MSGAAQCTETHNGYNGERRCTYPKGHDMAHAHYEAGQLVVAWVDREQFEAARARGDFDQPDFCHCAEPVAVCDTCGGEVL